MRRFLAVAVMASLLVPAASAPASDLPHASSPGGSAEGENYLVAGGGTNLTNGVFFPGTAECGSGGCESLLPPLQIEKGTDVEFVNLDPAILTNGHRILSKDRYKRGKKRGQPLFYSAQVNGPDTATLKTRHLKPGLYFYQCTTHITMFGAIEVVE